MPCCSLTRTQFSYDCQCFAPKCWLLLCVHVTTPLEGSLPTMLLFVLRLMLLYTVQLSSTCFVLMSCNCVSWKDPWLIFSRGALCNINLTNHIGKHVHTAVVTCITIILANASQCICERQQKPKASIADVATANSWLCCVICSNLFQSFYNGK